MPHLPPRLAAPAVRPSQSGQWPLALLPAAPLLGTSLESREAGPGVGCQGSRAQPLPLGVTRPGQAEVLGPWGLGTTYQGARRGSRGAWGRRVARKACWAPLGGWVGGTKLASRPQLKLAVSLRGNEHACQPPRSPLPQQAICRHVLLSPPGSPSSSHPQGLEGLYSEATPGQGSVLCGCHAV